MKQMVTRSLPTMRFGCLLAILALFASLPAQAQDAPRNLAASVRALAVELTWQPPALSSGENIAAYVIYRDTSPIPNIDPDETDASEIGRVTTPSGNPTTSFSDADVERGITYYYRITAEVQEQDEEDESDTDESDFSNEASATLPPAVTLTNPTLPNPESHPEDTPLTVEATLASDIGIASATLHIRAGGEARFTSLLQTLSAEDVAYEETITAENVTARGIDFYLTVTDTDDQTTRIPEDGYVSLQVSTDGLAAQFPGGTAQTAFRMVGFPFQLDNNQLSQILEDDLGPQRAEQWRLFSISPSGLTTENGGYVEIQNFSSTAQPGGAYWLITREDASISTGAGVSLPTNEPFAVPLQEGWNLISNPFAFDFPLSAVTVESTNSALNDVLAYEGTFVPLNQSDALGIMEGYLVRIADGGTGTLQFNPDLSASSEAPKQRTAPALDWAIDIRAQVQQARDVYNTAGVSSEAAVAYDDLDRFEPPPIGEYVSVAFPHEDWGTYRGAYRRDVRPATAGLQEWTFDVRSSLQDAVTLSFSGLETVPSSYSVWLVNERLGVQRNLRATPRYRFNALPDADPATFRLLVGPSEAVQRALAGATSLPERVTLFGNYPNPFTPSTTIRYALPAPMPVTLRVYDILGREVVTLRATERETAGTHTVVWNGRTRDGRSVASGTYLYRLQAGDTIRTGRMVLVR